MSLSPTQRSLQRLKDHKFQYAIVERYIPFAGKHGKRIDAFGFIDILAIGANSIIAIQSCGCSFSEHKKKILANEIAPEWLRAGGILELWSWRRVKLKRGGKAMRWKPRVYVFTLADFEC